MAIGTDISNPIRFGKGQTPGVTEADKRSLYLEAFGGEVIAAFNAATVTLDKHTVKQLKGAKSWRFPKTWMSQAEYFVPGTELMGNDFPTGEVVITADDILVAHHAFSDIDTLLSHFDIRSKASTQMGIALSQVYDKNVFRQIILTARAAAVGPFTPGTIISDAALLNAGAIDGKAWIDGIKAANKKLFEKNVPETMARYMAVNIDVFDAIKYAVDTKGNYLVLNRPDFGSDGAGGIANRVETMRVDGVTIYKTQNLPTINEAVVTSVYPKYRADFSKTTGVMWTDEAVGTAQLMGITMETTRDTRRLEDFMVAKMMVGHGTLRPECAVEFRKP